MKTQDIEMYVAIDNQFNWNADPTRQDAIDNLIGNSLAPDCCRIVKITLKGVTVPADVEVSIDCPPIAEETAEVHGEAVNA